MPQDPCLCLDLLPLGLIASCPEAWALFDPADFIKMRVTCRADLNFFWEHWVSRIADLFVQSHEHVARLNKNWSEHEMTCPWYVALSDLSRWQYLQSTSQSLLRGLDARAAKGLIDVLKYQDPEKKLELLCRFGFQAIKEPLQESKNTDSCKKFRVSALLVDIWKATRLIDASLARVILPRIHCFIDKVGLSPRQIQKCSLPILKFMKPAVGPFAVQIITLYADPDPDTIDQIMDGCGDSISKCFPELRELLCNGPWFLCCKAVQVFLDESITCVAPIVVELVNLLTREEFHSNWDICGLSGVFNKIGEPAIAPLAELFQNSNVAVVRIAIGVLHSMMEHNANLMVDSSAIPEIARLLQHPNDEIRSSGLALLSKIGGENKQSIALAAPLLACLLSDTEASIGQEALELLIDIVIDAPDTAVMALSGLEAALQDAREEVRISAAVVCEVMEDASRPLQKQLAILLSDTAFMAREHAFNAIRSHDHIKDVVVVAIASLLSDHRGHVRQISSKLLCSKVCDKATCNPAAAVPSLRKVMANCGQHSCDSNEACETFSGTLACDALCFWDFPELAVAAVPELLCMLRHSCPLARTKAAEAILRIGALGESQSRLELQILLEHPRPRIREAAAEAFEALGTKF